MRHLMRVRLDLLEQPEPLQLRDDRLARGEPVLALQAAQEGRIGDAVTGAIASAISSSVTRASRSRMVGIGRPCRWPTSKSLKSCAGVIFTAPVPFSGSE